MTNGNDILEYVQDNEEGLLEIWCNENGVDIEALMADDEWLEEVLHNDESFAKISLREYTERYC